MQFLNVIKKKSGHARPALHDFSVIGSKSSVLMGLRTYLLYI